MVATARKGKSWPVSPMVIYRFYNGLLLAVQVADPDLLQTYMQLLTKPEQAYVREGSSKAVQKERLLARTLQRTTLAKYLCCTPTCSCLTYSRCRQHQTIAAWHGKVVCWRGDHNNFLCNNMACAVQVLLRMSKPAITAL